MSALRKKKLSRPQIMFDTVQDVKWTRLSFESCKMDSELNSVYPQHYNQPLLCILKFTQSLSWWCKTCREEENIALVRGIRLLPRHWEMPCKHLKRRYSARVNVDSRQLTCRMDKEDSRVELENMMNVFFSLDFPIVNECFSGFNTSLPSEAWLGISLEGGGRPSENWLR